MQQAINRMLDVEIAPSCNLDCPDCLASGRLKDKRKGDYNPNIKNSIVEKASVGMRVNFIGLGEPTIPRYQADIAFILRERKDLLGFIQSNGSFLLSEELISLVNAGRLEIGVSYDMHHQRGKLPLPIVSLGIQGESVCGLSIAVDMTTKLEDDSTELLLKQFPNLRKVLVEPLHSLRENEPVVDYNTVRNFASGLQQQYDRLGRDVVVFTTLLPHLQHGKNKFYNLDAEGGLVHAEGEWYVDSKAGIYVLRRDVRKEEGRMPRLLTNGLVIDETTFAWLDWKSVSKKGEIYIDSRTGRVAEGNCSGDLKVKISEF